MGEFRRQGRLLRLRTDDKGNLAWCPIQTLWMKAEKKTGGNIFSSVGLSAESWEFLVRKQEMTVQDAIMLDGVHYFLTDIQEPYSGFLLVQAARVKIVMCRGGMEKQNATFSFPAAVTEKYVRHEEPRPMSMNIITYVLITPKQVALKAGSLVDVEGEAFEVMGCHTLDEYKNEFEVCRKKDL